MSNYLTRLVARTLAPVTLRPRMRLRFEDAPALQPVPEEPPAMTATAAARPILPDITSTPRHSEHLLDPAPAVPHRIEAQRSFEPAPPRESHARADDPRPSMAFELPRPAVHEDVRETPRTEVIRVDAPPQRITTHEPAHTIVDTRESIVHERETVTLQDERTMQTQEHVTHATVPTLAPARPPGEKAAVKSVVARAARRLSAPPPPPQAAAASEPTIHVSIGRIEVRATTQAAAPRRREAAPALTLDGYLERRNGKSGR